MPAWHNLVLRKPGKLVLARVSQFKGKLRYANVFKLGVKPNETSKIAYLTENLGAGVIIRLKRRSATKCLRRLYIANS